MAVCVAGFAWQDQRMISCLLHLCKSYCSRWILLRNLWRGTFCLWLLYDSTDTCTVYRRSLFVPWENIESISRIKASHGLPCRQIAVPATCSLLLLCVIPILRNIKRDWLIECLCQGIQADQNKAGALSWMCCWALCLYLVLWLLVVLAFDLKFAHNQLEGKWMQTNTLHVGDFAPPHPRRNVKGRSEAFPVATSWARTTTVPRLQARRAIRTCDLARSWSGFSVSLCEKNCL